MIPVSITLCRFGSFVKEQTFRFPKGPGLYFMQGLNEAEPRLERNGSGKSTVWKALTWVLFGKDPRGLKAGDVANWDQPKEARVTFVFMVNGEKWRIERQHSPNRWVMGQMMELIFGKGDVDLTKDSTNPVLAMLRLEFTPFLNCVLMAQGEDMFLDLKADAKATLFSEVMGLDQWLKFSERASSKAKAEDVLLRGFERQEADLRGKLSRLIETDYGPMLEDWEAKRSKRLREVELDYMTALDKSKQLKEQVEIVELEVSGYRDQPGLQSVLRMRVEALDGFKPELEALRAEYREADAQWRAAEIAAEEAQLRERDPQETDNCPTCGRPWEGDNHQPLRRFQADSKKACGLAESASETASKLRRRLERAEERGQGLARTAQEAREALGQGQRSVSDAKRLYELQERALDRLEEEADKITAEENPFARLQAQALKDGHRLRDELGEIQGRHTRAAERYSMLGFWVRGFKDVRLQLIAESLQQLAIEVNSCVTTLGLVDWELVFEVDRETKSGSIQRGFSVFVKSPHNERLVPWDAWSGGEAQRLRLADQMGLANLIRSATGATFDLEVWDEPTNGMSARGITDLLDSLAVRARQERRQVWIVDHRSLGYGGFDGGVTVVKDRKGSRFVDYTY